jgi:5-methylcytosine-specific restriction enzyme A
MGRKDERKGRRSESVKTFWEMPLADTDHEKKRARELRNTAWWRQKVSRGICHYCSKVFKPDDLTMDHIIPLSRGGRSEKLNIVPACKECNNKKKYLLPSEWEEYLLRIQGKRSSDSKPEIDESTLPE